MPNSDPTAHAPMSHLDWSRAEKAIARRAFDRALQQEIDSLIHEAKQRAAKITQPPELWDLEAWLTECRTRIDRKYDYRYSVLPDVFGRLIFEGRITEDDLRGLSEDKLELIRRCIEFLRRA